MTRLRTLGLSHFGEPGKLYFLCRLAARTAGGNTRWTPVDGNGVLFEPECFEFLFVCREACAGDSPGHVFALTSTQLAQLDALFTGEAVRTVSFYAHGKLEHTSISSSRCHTSTLLCVFEKVCGRMVHGQAVTAIIYTVDGEAESLACTTYVADETQTSPGLAAGTGGAAAIPPIAVIPF